MANGRCSAWPMHCIDHCCSVAIVEWPMAAAGAAFAAANMGHRPMGLTGVCSIGMDDEWLMQQHYSI
jgi:hypothetical protein